MADAWETLIANSSLDTGDAWEHLNAQEGGGFDAITYILHDGLDLEIEMACYELEIDVVSFEIEIEEPEFEIEIETQEFELEICNG